MAKAQDLYPQDLDAEKAVLGGIVLDGELFKVAKFLLLDEDFSIEQHRRIYRAMGELEEAGTAIDRVTLAGKLRDNGHLETIGGLTYLVSLDEGVSAVFGVDDYCKRVKDKSLARQSILALHHASQQISQQGVVGDVLESLQGNLRGLQNCSMAPEQFSTVDTILGTGEDGTTSLDDLFTKMEASCPTPFRPLNEMLAGGLRGAEVALLAARPSQGKTAMALQFAYAAAASEHRIPIAFFSLEQEKEALLVRLACQVSGVDSNRVRSSQITSNERRKLMLALSDLRKLPLFINDHSTQSLGTLTSALTKFKEKHELGLVVIDYLQLMQVKGRFENRNAAVSHLSRELKLLAKELKVPFLILSQLKRLENEDSEPGNQDLRESGALEQDADIVMFIHGKSKQYGPTRMSNILLKKQRNGPVGFIPLTFLASSMKFELRTPEVPDVPAPTRGPAQVLDFAQTGYDDRD